MLFQDAASLSQSGARALRESRFGDAEQAYRQLVQREPENPMWRMNLGIVLDSAGRYQEAIPQFQAFLNARPQPGAIHWMTGLAYLKLRQSCEAIALLEKAKQWDARRATVDLGDAYLGCDRFEQAARTYESALAFGSRDGKLARQTAHCYWRARLYPQARKMFAPLAASFAGDPEFQYEYGDTLARLEGPEAGLPFLLKAAGAVPEMPGARGEAGKALLAVGRAGEAIPHLQAASEKDPTLLLALSRAYRQTGRTADAQRAQEEYRSKVGAGKD